jgi:hypothetical protein
MGGLWGVKRTSCSAAAYAAGCVHRGRGSLWHHHHRHSAQGAAPGPASTPVGRALQQPHECSPEEYARRGVATT